MVTLSTFSLAQEQPFSIYLEIAPVAK